MKSKQTTNTNLGRATDDELLKAMQGEISDDSVFLKVSRMAYKAWSRRTQSMDCWAEQLGVSKGSFNNYKQLGMALEHLNYTDEELTECGPSTLYRIAAAYARGAVWNKDDEIGRAHV